MSHSVADHLRQDLECEDLLECVHGLKSLDRECYRALATADEPLTIDAIADRIDRERSTAYRSVQRLLEAGLLEQDQVNYEHGGYYHVYRPIDPDTVADEMQAMVDDWHDEMAALVTEFREDFGERVRTEPLSE